MWSKQRENKLNSAMEMANAYAPFNYMSKQGGTFAADGPLYLCCRIIQTLKIISVN